MFTPVTFCVVVEPLYVKSTFKLVIAVLPPLTTLTVGVPLWVASSAPISMSATMASNAGTVKGT